ncbi:MAG TPA: efflux RND transporter periplasmic adaptor subunit [Polyangiaceae bacterium]|nr:efflux RND transporter periplasmic adaptor subunit [Polyangiaceae bacterium]
MTSTVSPPPTLDLAAPPLTTAPSPSAVRSPSRSAPTRRRTSYIALATVAALGTLFLAGYAPKRAREAALARDAASRSVEPPRVVTVRPTPSKGERPLTLPGSVEPLETAQVHSRASGFVTEWYADLGDQVEAGQLLARLDTPELDRETQQARATLARADASILQAKATAEYSASTHRRYAALAPEGVISLQELAQYAAQAHVDAANIRVAQAERGARAAELERLEQLQRFARVVAPFAGTVSARHVERGALVNGAASGPLYEIVVTDPVRVFIRVPQSLVPDVRAGLPVDVAVSEYPGVAFAGQLTRASGALDPESRTMRVEVRVPNADGRLLPGMYASVKLTLARGRPSFLLPATALVSGSAGPHVASVGADAEVHLIPVDVKRDYGAEVEIEQGLDGSERIVRTPGPQLRDGARVLAAEPAPPQSTEPVAAKNSAAATPKAAGATSEKGGPR